jgi:hypothetical protein
LSFKLENQLYERLTDLLSGYKLDFARFVRLFARFVRLVDLRH